MTEAGNQTMDVQKYRTRRFVLRVPRAEWEMAAVARLHGWSYVGERPAAEGRPRVLVFEALPGVSVWYWEIDDPYLCAVTIDSSPGPEPIATVATLVQATLMPFMLTELVKEIDNESDRLIGLWRAGFGAPEEADPTFLTRFSAAAARPDPDVRFTAILAMAQTGWPECGPIIERAARDDGDKEIRKIAEHAMQLLPRMRPQGRPVPVDVPDLFPDQAKELYPIAREKLGEVVEALRQDTLESGV
jgi:hypothetical protein